MSKKVKVKVKKKKEQKESRKWYDLTPSNSFSVEGCDEIRDNDKKNINTIKTLKKISIVFLWISIFFPFSMFGMIGAIDCKAVYTFDYASDGYVSRPTLPSETFVVGLNLSDFTLTEGNSANYTIAFHDVSMNMVLVSTYFFDKYLKDNFTNTFLFYSALGFGGDRDVITTIFPENMAEDFLKEVVTANIVSWMDITENPYVKTPVGIKILLYKTINLRYNGSGEFNDRFTNMIAGWYGFLNDSSLVDTNKGKWNFIEDDISVTINASLTETYWTEVRKGFGGMPFDFEQFTESPYQLHGEVVKTNWFSALGEIIRPIA